MLHRLRSRIARFLAGAPAPADLPVGPAPAGLPLPVMAELQSFHHMVLRLGGDPAEETGTTPVEPAGWKVELARVKAQRHRVLGTLREAPGVPHAVRQGVEACLLRGWHLVFHCYAMATGLLPEEHPDELRLRREDLRQAYAAGLQALMPSARV